MGKFSLWLVEKHYKFRKIRGKPPVSAARIHTYRKLYPGENLKELLMRRDARLLSRILWAGVAGVILYLLIIWMQEKPEAVTSLERPEYGNGEKIYEMEVVRGEEHFPVEVTVGEQNYTEQEMVDKFNEAYKEVLNVMLGKNESLEKVTVPLSLPSQALGGIIRAEWTSKTRELLDDWGEIVKEQNGIEEEGEEGRYLLSLICGDVIREYEIALTVYPESKTEEERFLDVLKTEIEKYSYMNQESEEMKLPEKCEGRELVWYVKPELGMQYFILIFPLTAALFFLASDRQRQKEALQRREKEMLMDYPELISKFTVLIQAGMTTRNVWERIVKEYEEKRKKNQKSRFAYEEMKITLSQMKNGVYESQAYGEFGRRCGLHSYLKFSALLEQNLKQGTTRLALRLTEEAEAAFEERKSLARRMGEEAQTKLMLPMFMMLAVVLIVVMVPAFMAF